MDRGSRDRRPFGKCGTANEHYSPVIEETTSLGSPFKRPLLEKNAKRRGITAQDGPTPRMRRR